MTQPAPQQQNEQQRTAALAGMLASTMPPVALIAGFATLAAVPRPMAMRLLEQTPSRLPADVARRGPAARAVAAAEPTYRAAYLLAAAHRVQVAVAGGQTLEEALAAEQRHTLAHQHAQANRARAAGAVDQAAARQRSSLLGWQARMDSRTSADCRAANGRNFSILAPPAIGLPGSVHPNCRCRPVAAFAGAPMVGEQTRRRVAVA